VMIGAAMGLAARGAIPFPSTFAAFLSRAADFIRMAAISNLNIKMAGSHAGVSIGEDGPSQMALEDLAMMRAQPNITVLYPCDAVSTDRLVEAMASHQGPAYMRTSRPKTPVIYGPDETFPIGGLKVLRQSDADAATVIGAGVTVFEALKAYDQLKASGTRPGDDFHPPPHFGEGADFDFSNLRDGEGFSDFFESLFGRAGGARAGARPGPRRGQDVRATVEIDLETAFAGGKQRLHVGERVLEVKIPAGILTGQTIRLAGQGNPGFGGGTAGDLLLEIAIQPHPRFRLDGRDVQVKVPLAPWEAALGATVSVPTLAGDVELRIPAGSDSGRRLRLKGRGMPGKEPGDQYVELEVYAPPALTETQRELYEQMAREFAPLRV